MASFSGVDGSEDHNWYVDSGATNHVTANLQNLNLHQDYKGKGKLTIGNGSKLQISHIGDIFVHSPHSQKHLVLHNTLHVLEITKNLISISQFTKDNDVVIEFFSDFCLVKDKVTGNILLEEALKQGLYQLNISKVHPNLSKVQSLVSCFDHQCNTVNVSDSNSNSVVSNNSSNSNVQSETNVSSRVYNAS